MSSFISCYYELNTDDIPDQLKRHQRTTHKDPSASLLSPSPDHFTLPFAIA